MIKELRISSLLKMQINHHNPKEVALGAQLPLSLAFSYTSGILFCVCFVRTLQVSGVRSWMLGEWILQFGSRIPELLCWVSEEKRHQ